MSKRKIKLHFLPKQKINLLINEYGDIYNNKIHLGELNLFNDLNIHLIGTTGPTGPYICGLRGSRGNIGIDGSTGPIGYSTTGPMGDMGDDGPRGMIGSIGPRGREGDIGDKGDTGPKGDVKYKNPRYFLYAKVNNDFMHGNDDFNVIPWYHISNNGFKIANDMISFPNETGVYKIEIGLQLTAKNHCTHSNDDLEASSMQIELCFTKKRTCKSTTYVIPYCQTKIMNISNCDTLHYIHIVDEPTDMYIKLNTHSHVQNFEKTMYMTIIEII